MSALGSPGRLAGVRKLRTSPGCQRGHRCRAMCIEDKTSALHCCRGRIGLRTFEYLSEPGYAVLPRIAVTAHISLGICYHSLPLSSGTPQHNFLCFCWSPASQLVVRSRVRGRPQSSLWRSSGAQRLVRFGITRRKALSENGTASPEKRINVPIGKTKFAERALSRRGPVRLCVLAAPAVSLSLCRQRGISLQVYFEVIGALAPTAAI